MTAIRFLLVLLGLALLVGGALARSGFEANAFKVMHLERVAGSPLANANCQICHVKPSGDAPWNSFGLAVGFWRGKKQTIQDAIYSAIRYGGDTDRDGYPDVFERMVGSNPTDKSDNPGEKLDDLKKRLDANFVLQADSDTDGFPDALEVVAGTLPGDAASRPNQAVDVLMEQLSTLGGVEYFLPKR